MSDYHTTLNQKLNAYVAVLLVTLFSSGITLTIVDVGTTKVIASVMEESKANRAALQDSIQNYRSK